MQELTVYTEAAIAWVGKNIIADKFEIFIYIRHHVTLLSFHHSDYLVHIHLFQYLSLTARPVDFQSVYQCMLT